MDFLKNGPGGFLSGVITSLLVNEVRAWSPSLAARLIRLAVKRLPFDLRERLSEEWTGYLADVPGDLGKLWCAAGFYQAAGSITRERLWKSLIEVARIVVRHPMGTWKFIVVWRNWGRAATILRRGGHSVPWSPLELGPSELLKRYGKERAPAVQSDTAEIVIWAKTEKITFLLLLCVALRKNAKKMCAYMGFPTEATVGNSDTGGGDQGSAPPP